MTNDTPNKIADVANISPIIKDKAPAILAEVKKAKSILLCCHPSPDPDSVGSCLAMKFALESLGKKATVIKGDSDIPEAFMHFPGADQIVKKNFFEINQKEFDLFMVLDLNALDRISLLAPVAISSTMDLVMIDHHQPKPAITNVSLIESTYPATCQILYDLFVEWNVNIDANIASNLFIGMYTDTGGFKYRGTSAATYKIASALVDIIPDFTQLISKMENSGVPADIAFYGKAFTNIKTFLGGHLALSSVSHTDLVALGIADTGMKVSGTSSRMCAVADWYIVGALTEIEVGKIKCSFRSKDAVKYDVSILTQSFGGGGHKSAAGVMITGTMDEVEEKIVARAKELYNL